MYEPYKSLKNCYQYQLKARQSRQNQMYFSSQNQVRCEAGQQEGSWRVFLYLFLLCNWFWHESDQVYLIWAKTLKRKLQLSHFLVSYTCCRVSVWTDATVATAARAKAAAERDADKTWPRKFTCGGDNHPETPSTPGSVGLARGHPLTKNQALQPSGQTRSSYCPPYPLERW